MSVVYTPNVQLRYDKHPLDETIVVYENRNPVDILSVIVWEIFTAYCYATHIATELVFVEFGVKTIQL